MDRLLELARRAVWGAVLAEGVPGLLGKADGTLSYIDAQGTSHPDMCWARIGGEGTSNEMVVRCTTVQRIANMPVLIASRNGRPTVIRTDTERALVFTGGRPADLPVHWHTHRLLGTDPGYLEGQQVLPLMARPTDPADLTVTVEPGFYRYDGVEHVLERTVSGSLAAYVPGPNLQKFVIVCLDRVAGELAIVEGTSSASLSSLPPFTVADVAAIDVDDTYYPLAAVRLYNGQTQIKPLDIFLDCRLWGGELWSTAGGTASLVASAIMVDADFNIMIDADYNVMVES
jgi:hypothetical protein